MPEDEVTYTDEQWSSAEDGTALLVRIYRLKETVPAVNESERTVADDRRLYRCPAILDVHGGTWTYKDRTLDELCNRSLAAAGFVVAAIDFRQGPVHQHPAASCDVVNALQWLRSNADRLDIDPNNIGITGSSSGGHLALYASIPLNASHQRTQHDLSLVIAPPKYNIALWPVSDPFARYRYAKRANIERLVQASEGYFGTEDAMRDASVPRVVVAGEAESSLLPPLLFVQPGEDGNVPVEITFDLMRAWQNRDGYLEYSFFPGQPHGFGLLDCPSTRRMTDLVVDFAKRFSK